MEQSIHIHEDDWGMRNLHPLEALEEAQADVQEAAVAGLRNRTSDGSGWTDVHQIQEPGIDYSKFGLRVGEVAIVLEHWMPRVRRFTATAGAGFDSEVRDPWGRYEEDAYCFGFDASCFLYLDTDGELVQKIWFHVTTTKESRVEALRSAILAIDGLVPSMIADYWMDTAGPVGDREFLDRYFRLIKSKKI